MSGTSPAGSRCSHCGQQQLLSSDCGPFFEDELGDDDVAWPAAILIPLVLGILMLPRLGPTTTAVAIGAVSAVEIASIIGLRRLFIRRRRSSRDDPVEKVDVPVAARELRNYDGPDRDSADRRTSPPMALASAASNSTPSADPSTPDPTIVRGSGPISAGLDEVRIAQRRQDSEQARQALQAWNFAANEEKPPVATPETTSPMASQPHGSASASSLLGALDEEERLFAVAVAQRPHWSSEELLGLTRSYGLMKDAAIDSINEASLRLFAVAVLIETSTGVDVDLDTFRRSRS